MISRRLDLPRIGLGAAVAGGLGLTLALALLRQAEARADPGPTAAALDDAFSAWLGAGLGIALGAAVCALSIRHGSRALAGFLAGLTAYVLVLVPVEAATLPDDVALSEEASFAFFMLPVAGAFAALGGCVGSFLAALARHDGKAHAASRNRRSLSPKPPKPQGRLASRPAKRSR